MFGGNSLGYFAEMILLLGRFARTLTRWLGGLERFQMRRKSSLSCRGGDSLLPCSSAIRTVNIIISWSCRIKHRLTWCLARYLQTCMKETVPALMKRIAIATQRVGHFNHCLLDKRMTTILREIWWRPHYCSFLHPSLKDKTENIKFGAENANIDGSDSDSDESDDALSLFQVLFLLECTILPKEDIQLNTRVTFDHKMVFSQRWQCILITQVFHWPKDMAAVFDLAKTRIGNKRDQVNNFILIAITNTHINNINK